MLYRHDLSVKPMHFIHAFENTLTLCTIEKSLNLLSFFISAATIQYKKLKTQYQ